MIVIVDYGVGNLLSLTNAIRHLGYKASISSSPRDISAASKIILPGVGAFQAGINNIHRSGLQETIVHAANSGANILGICLGYQLLTKSSNEFGEHLGLGILNGVCRKLNPGPKRTLPHIGWNTVRCQKPSLGYGPFLDGKKFYFVHSFAVKTEDSQISKALTNYGDEEFVSASQFNNVIGVQFHPEKSGEAGLNFLRYFINLD